MKAPSSFAASGIVTPATQINSPKDLKFLVRMNFPSVRGAEMFTLYFIVIRQS